MRSKGTKGSVKKRRMSHLEYLQICPTYKIRRLTPREVDQFRKGVQAIIDRTVRA